MGVHVRQGDALDLKNGFFNYDSNPNPSPSPDLDPDPSPNPNPTLPLTLGFFNYEPSAHDDAYVALFAAEMRALCSTCAAAGQRALFFLASDQARCWRRRPEPEPWPQPSPSPRH